MNILRSAKEMRADALKLYIQLDVKDMERREHREGGKYRVSVGNS